MPKRILLLLLTGALALGGCKKDLLSWSQVQRLNSNTTLRLNHIHFLGPDVCIISGGLHFQQSEILRSTDGGYTWASYSSDTAPKEMYGMGLSANGTVYLCGVDGDVLYSADSGKTWKFNRINDWLVYCGGSFLSKDTGIFVSAVLQRQCTITRVDSSFKILDEKTFLFGLNNFYRADAQTAYAIGYGTVMKTTDRGNTWNYQDASGDNFMAMDVHGDEIWMCGYNGSVYHTLDGGNNWNKVRNGNDITLPRYNLLDIVFRDSQNGWATCDDGKVIRTDDGGTHWEEYDRFTTSALRSIAICPNGDLLVAGDGGVVFRLTTQ